MPRRTSIRPDFSARLSFWLLTGFLVILWFAGGASRADVTGQAVNRFFAWTILIAFALLAPKFEWRRVKPVAMLLGIAILLVALQLVPLPPTIWTALPGRELFTRAAEVSGQPQPWRPLSISPSGTANALGSLVIPSAVLVLCAQLTREQHWRIAELLLILVVAGCVLALVQFSGSRFDNPLINYQRGSVSGNFANRNHFALFVAFGCCLAPVWGFRAAGHDRWKAIVAIAVIPLFLLVILATGSRAGLLLGAMAIAAGAFLVRSSLVREFRVLPRWAAISIVTALVGALAGAVLLSITLGRAIAIDRVFDLAATDDLRSRALPSVIEALLRYFPAGTGFGTFDPVYRIGEPYELLQPQYFNHAHNDWLEIVLDGGIAGVGLLLGAIVWSAIAAIRAWRAKRDGRTLNGAAVVGLTLLALSSTVDYPARTPMFMALIIILGVWLNQSPRASEKMPSPDTAAS